MLRSTTGRTCVPTHYGHDQLAHSPLQPLAAPPVQTPIDETGGRHCQLGSQPLRSPLQSMGVFPTVLATPVGAPKETRPTVTAMTSLTNMPAFPTFRRPAQPPPLMRVPRLDVLYDSHVAPSSAKRPASTTASITSEPKRFVPKRSSTAPHTAGPGLKLLNQTMIRSQPPLL
jgi:hypothetical protein